MQEWAAELARHVDHIDVRLACCLSFLICFLITLHCLLASICQVSTQSYVQHCTVCQSAQALQARRVQLHTWPAALAVPFDWQSTFRRIAVPQLWQSVTQCSTCDTFAASSLQTASYCSLTNHGIGYFNAQEEVATFFGHTEDYIQLIVTGLPSVRHTY